LFSHTQYSRHTSKSWRRNDVPYTPAFRISLDPKFYTHLEILEEKCVGFVQALPLPLPLLAAAAAAAADLA
jgi:hypothetical protein